MKQLGLFLKTITISGLFVLLPIVLTIVYLWTGTDLVFAQVKPSPSASGTVSDYEELLELKASEILRDDMLAGPHHKVREEVPTYSGANRFIIDSQFGVFEAEGNEVLVRRVNEINAIAKLKDVSRTDEYKAAVAKAAKAPVAAAKRIASDPIGTIESAPKGIMKFMSRAGESIKGMGKNRTRMRTKAVSWSSSLGFRTPNAKSQPVLG
jgi:hypothetical protein